MVNITQTYTNSIFYITPSLETNMILVSILVLSLLISLFVNDETINLFGSLGVVIIGIIFLMSISTVIGLFITLLGFFLMFR